MSTLQQVLNELHDVAAHVSLRPDYDSLNVSMMTSVVAKLMSAPVWTAAKGLAITRRLSEIELPHHLADLLTNASDERLAETYGVDPEASPSPPAGRGYPHQCLKDPQNYLTATDWRTVDAPSTDERVRDRVFAERLSKLNVQHASEDGLVKWVIANSLVVEQRLYGSWPSYWSIYYRVARVGTAQSKSACSFRIVNHIGLKHFLKICFGVSRLDRFANSSNCFVVCHDLLSNLTTSIITRATRSSYQVR